MGVKTCSKYYVNNDRNYVKISVILPVYNSEKYLKETLKSLLRQTFDDYEIICIDDCSSDGSFEILKQYHEKYPDKIILLKNETNLGIVKTLNKGISIANGKYIARMDADDICHLERLKKQYRYLEKHPNVGICGCQINKFGALNRKVYLPCSPVDVKAALLFNCCLIHPSVVMRSDVIKKNNIFYCEDYEYAEDFEFWTRMMQFCEIANLKERLLSYRVHTMSISSSKSSKQKELERKIIKQQLNKYFPQLSNEEICLICGLEQLTPTNVKNLYTAYNKILEINNNTEEFNCKSLKKALNKYLCKLLKNKFAENSDITYLKEIFRYNIITGFFAFISKFYKIIRKK